MKFDQYVNLILESLEQKRTYAVLPGGFKPPHKGHFEALKHLLVDADEGIVFIGNKERCGITAEQSKDIWEIYAKYLDKTVEVSISQVSPINSTYEFTDTHSDDSVVVGVGPENDPKELKRYDYFKKNPEKYPNVSIVEIPAKYDRISGTKTRECIMTKSESAINYFVPGVVSAEDRDQIAKILGL